MQGQYVEFTTVDTQKITIDVIFADYANIDDVSIGIIADAVLDNLTGPQVAVADSHCEYTVSDDCTMVNIKVYAEFDIHGSCTFYPGKYYGPWEDSYPDEIDDYDYISGFATGCDVRHTLEVLSDFPTPIVNMDVTIDEPTYESEYNIIERPEED